MDRLLVLQVAQCWICPSCQQVPHNGLLGWPRGQGSRHVEGCVPMGLRTVRRGLIRIQTQLAWTLNIILHTLPHSHPISRPFDIPEPTSTTTFPHISESDTFPPAYVHILHIPFEVLYIVSSVATAHGTPNIPLCSLCHISHNLHVLA